VEGEIRQRNASSAWLKWDVLMLLLLCGFTGGVFPTDGGWTDY
jgi:hypothetical protein